MRDLATRLGDCAINTATLGFQAPLTAVIDEVARAGFGGIAPWRREVEVSACEKAWNSRVVCSGVMPMPVAASLSDAGTFFRPS